MFESLRHHIPKRIGKEKETSFAVLIPLIKKEDGYHVLFEVRARHLNKQPGEVCFPDEKWSREKPTYERRPGRRQKNYLYKGNILKSSGP